MTEKRIYEGKVLSQAHYDSPTRQNKLGVNADFPDYCYGSCFSLSRFLKGLEGKRVRLTLEVIE